MNGDCQFIELFTLLYREEHSQMKIVSVQKIAADTQKIHLLSCED